jgi:hypothetical protein
VLYNNSVGSFLFELLCVLNNVPFLQVLYQFSICIYSKCTNFDCFIWEGFGVIRFLSYCVRKAFYHFLEISDSVDKYRRWFRCPWRIIYSGFSVVSLSVTVFSRLNRFCTYVGAIVRVLGSLFCVPFLRSLTRCHEFSCPLATSLVSCS